MKIKQIIFSVLVVVVIIAYAIYQRLGKVNNPSLVNNKEKNEATTSVKVDGKDQAGIYEDGEYVSAVIDAFYGKVQVAATINGGRIVDIKFLSFPDDQITSQNISKHATPILETEAIAAQSAKVDTVSGATQTSEGFRKALASALAQAAK